MVNISNIIKEKGYTIQDVANKLGKSRITIAQNISVNGNPTLSTLRKIADAIGCKVGDFFIDEMSVPPQTIESVTIDGRIYKLTPA